MTVSSLFPTKLYKAERARGAAALLNRDLERACHLLRTEDRAGRAWSRQNHYPGYTSYASLGDLPRRAPAFAALQEELDTHVAAFARTLQFDLGRRCLALDSMWVNVLEGAGVHSAHIHPHAAVSGTYYVKAPKGSGALKLEDPRLP